MRARIEKSKLRPPRQMRRITVLLWPRERHRGIVLCGPLVLPCALGSAGVTHLKREGDGATPAGRYRLLYLYFRHDRTLPPPTRLPLRAMRRHDSWCEDPADGRYNCPVRLPPDAAGAAAHDAMWRSDHLYDVVGVLDWNLSPRVRGRGSAIFLHLCRPGYRPTAGCIALQRRHLALLLAAAGPRPELCVASKPRRIEPAATSHRLLRGRTAHTRPGA
jgi:L,D-peptidoglycan transpeptidase YkuD (ErfK/YbiS/YcfS/YnhG family)